MTEDVIRNIRIYSRYGCSYAEIAERTGAAFSEIRKVIEEEKAMRKTSPEKREEIMQCLENGMKRTEITEKCGVSRSTVQRAANDLREGKKKESETAATETNSKDNDTNFTNIVHQSEENVKPFEKIFSKKDIETIKIIKQLLGDAADKSEEKINRLLRDELPYYERKRDVARQAIAELEVMEKNKASADEEVQE